MVGIVVCEKFVIVVINGFIVGGGFEIVMCCDICIVFDNVWFGLFELEWGFFVGFVVVMFFWLMLFGVVVDMMLVGECLSV